MTATILARDSALLPEIFWSVQHDRSEQTSWHLVKLFVQHPQQLGHGLGRLAFHFPDQCPGQFQQHSVPLRLTNEMEAIAEARQRHRDAETDCHTVYVADVDEQDGEGNFVFPHERQVVKEAFGADEAEDGADAAASPFVVIDGDAVTHHADSLDEAIGYRDGVAKPRRVVEGTDVEPRPIVPHDGCNADRLIPDKLARFTSFRVAFSIETPP